MDPQGENALLVGNYKAGVRLLDTTDKSAPEEISFYLPNNNGGGATPNAFVVGRRTWVALFGSGDLVYASDMTMGFFVLRLNEQTVLPGASFAVGRRAPEDGLGDVRIVSGAGRHSLEFVTSRPGLSTLSVYDVAGRRVALRPDGERAPGTHVLEWDTRTDTGQRAARGIYLGRLTTPDGTRTVKLLHLAP
jgi:hypothetical protein